MALDPNGIFSQGAWDDPEDFPASLPDGVEKSRQYYAQYTVYNDGHRTIQWYKRGTGDGKNDPVLSTTTDTVPKRETDWAEQVRKEKADARSEQGGVKPTSVTIGTNPSSGKPSQVSVWPDGHTTYDDTQVPAAQSQQTTTPHIEGTPKGDGTYDNSHPIMVNRDASGKQVGAARELTGPEREQWERDQNQTAGRGSMTNEEIRNNGKPTITAVTINGQRYTTQTTPGQNGAPPTIQNFGPDGKPIDKLPAEVKPGQVIKGGGKDGEDVQAVVGPDGRTISYQPIPGAVAPGTVNVPSDAPKIDTSTPERAHASFLQLYQWVDAQVRSGMPQAKAKAILEGPYQAVNLVLNRQKEERAQEQQRVTNALTQRSQDMTQSGNRLGAANSQFSTALADAEKVNLLADPGTNAAASVLLGNLALQRIHGEQMGGMRDSPGVVPGPAANLPTYGPLPTPTSAGQTAAAAAPTAPPAVQGTPSPVGDTGAPPMPVTNAAPRQVAPVAPPAAPRPDQTQVGGQIDNAIMPPQAGGGTKQMVAVDLGDETVYYDPTSDLLNAGGRMVDVPADRPNAFREPKSAAAPTMKQDIPPASPIPSDMPSSPYGAPMVPGGPTPGILSPPQPPMDVTPPSFSGDQSRMPMVYPTMAMAGSFSGGHPYQGAIDSLRALGLSEDAIQEALKAHTGGAAA